MNKTAMQLMIHTIEETVIGDKWDDLKKAMLELEKEQILKAFHDGKFSERVNHSIDPETVKKGKEIQWDFNTSPEKYFDWQYSERESEK